MVSGKKSKVEDGMGEPTSPIYGVAKDSGISKKGRSKGTRGPSRPYKSFAQDKLDNLVETFQNRIETLDAKVRISQVRLKAYKTEQAAREDVDATNDLEVPKKGRKANSGPSRPYRRLPQDKLEKLIDTFQTRFETMDAKLRIAQVRLKAYKSEQAART